ncbi:MAG: LytTR family transcriptional regulator [Clostridia bacterium]|nr:LytTR family transcriptional regulator [Clostridia bacterium]
MKYKIEIVESQNEDFVICAKQPSETLDKIKALLRESEQVLFGYTEGGAVRLDEKDVDCFFTEGGRVYALTKEGRFLVKERLFRLEEMLSVGFVKINQSCLVNLSAITRFETSIGGALLVVLRHGYRDYVSRRQLKTVKERIGI